MTENEYEILREAKLLRKDPSLVFPELNISVHPYTLFIYIWKFLSEAAEVEIILKELKAASHPEIIDLLDDLKEGRYEKREDIIDFLKEFGLVYVDEFIAPYPPPLKEGEFFLTPEGLTHG
jgi:hypothetical protein